MSEQNKAVIDDKAGNDVIEQEGISDWQSRADYEVLLERALMLKNIRAFFDGKGVIEVETPLLSHSATTDPHLESLWSRFAEQKCYLNTSPEYAMKRLLAQWKQPVYQVCKAFRDDELGTNHNPEFTMLEWYRPNFSMQQLMDELAELVGTLCRLSSLFTGGVPVFERLSYQQAFEKCTGINPHRATATDCYQFALSNNIEIPQGLGDGSALKDDVDEWLDWLLLQCVFPTFSKQGFTFLCDYPVSQCALAKIADAEPPSGGRVAKRFELFFGEVELANGFYELTDGEEQLQRFKKENSLRQKSGGAAATIDDNFIAALDYGLPDCSGVALGLDRLLMVLANRTRINQVLSFSWENC